ncbi:hypothetical protein BLA29_002077 [Euroglyphus maynei]|uniref:N-acetyltransferase domain-containing protein n=1 Tax=Euroglyphus maynei TaxID=6958 RepID=A0A1Y3AS71_EURMA|nr:hypothetical protein BLA29_002077 [Euroglyphus maynei]
MPIQAVQYKIRHLKRHEIEQLLQLCKAEGRHMGTVAEVETWMQIDPNAFFVAVNEKDHRIIGSCCGMCLSKTHGYVGMYVVSKEYRGLGIGKQVWSAAINHLGTRNQGLSAVSHLFTLYRDKAGFSQVADWTVDLYRLDYMERMILIHCNKHQQIKRRKYEKRKNHLMTVMIGDGDGHEDVDDADKRRRHEHVEIISSLTTKECVFCCLGHQYKSKERKYLRQKRMMINMNIILNGQDEQLIEKVVLYDQRLHQYDRSRFVRLTLIEKNCISRIAVLGQTVVGYGCAKPSLQNMWIMCPLYADNEYVARMLMIDLISDLILISQSSTNTIIPSVVLKTPSNNHQACRLLKELGFVKQDYSLKRCYTKQVVQVPTQFIYALHTSVFCTE